MTKPVTRSDVVHQTSACRNGRDVQERKLVTPEAIQFTDLGLRVTGVAMELAGKTICRAGVSLRDHIDDSSYYVFGHDYVLQNGR